MAEWMKRANCREMDPELFYDPPGNQYRPAVKAKKEAIVACKACKVSDECYIHALRHETFGFWAGTTEADRRRLRKAAGIAVEPLGVPLVLLPHYAQERSRAV